MPAAYDLSNAKKPLEGRFSVGLIVYRGVNAYDHDIVHVAVHHRAKDDAFPTGCTGRLDSQFDGNPKRLDGLNPANVTLRIYTHRNGDGTVSHSGALTYDGGSYMKQSHIAIAAATMKRAAPVDNASSVIGKIGALIDAFGCEWFAEPSDPAHRMTSYTDWTYRPPLDAIAAVQAHLATIKDGPIG